MNAVSDILSNGGKMKDTGQQSIFGEEMIEQAKKRKNGKRPNCSGMRKMRSAFISRAIH